MLNTTGYLFKVFNVILQGFTLQRFSLQLLKFEPLILCRALQLQLCPGDFEFLLPEQVLDLE